MTSHQHQATVFYIGDETERSKTIQTSVLKLSEIWNSRTTDRQPFIDTFHQSISVLFLRVQGLNLRYLQVLRLFDVIQERLGVQAAIFHLH